MNKKFTIELGEPEVRELMGLIPQNPRKHGKLRAKLAPAFLETESNQGFKSFTASAAPGTDPMMQVIINALATITGYPASSITPATKLSDLGMTTVKYAQLTVALNNYLATIPGSTPIGPTELAALSTVQDVYNLMQSKTP